MMEKAKRKADEGSDEWDLDRTPTAKRFRADDMQVNFSTLTFPQKLWHIVENETYRSIGWHQWGTCIVIDVELFLAEILSRQGELKIFETSAKKSFLRQLNLYGFKKMRRLEGGRTSLDGVESTSKKEVYHNIYFRQGHPELLIHVKRRLQVKAKRGSGFKPRTTVFTSLGQTPQPGLSEEPMMHLDHDPSQDTVNEAPSQSAEPSSAAESSPDSTNMAPTSTNELRLTAAQLQTTLAEWIALYVPAMSPSAQADLSSLVSRALAQPCPKCGHNPLCSEDAEEAGHV